MKPQLYDPNNPIKWRELPFEELLKLVEGRLNFHAHRHQHKIPGFDQQDIRQELVFALWNKLEKIPTDLDVFDYRFLRYVDTIFFREITNIWRSKTCESNEPEEGEETDQETAGKKKPRRVFKDELNRSLPMIDNFDELYDE